VRCCVLNVNDRATRRLLREAGAAATAGRHLPRGGAALADRKVDAAALGTVALTTFFVGLSAHPFIAPRATDVALIMALAIGMVRLPHHLPH